MNVLVNLKHTNLYTIFREEEYVVLVAQKTVHKLMFAPRRPKNNKMHWHVFPPTQKHSEVIL